MSHCASEFLAGVGACSLVAEGEGEWLGPGPADGRELEGRQHRQPWRRAVSPKKSHAWLSVDRGGQLFSSAPDDGLTASAPWAGGAKSASSTAAEPFVHLTVPSAVLDSDEAVSMKTY